MMLLTLSLILGCRVHKDDDSDPAPEVDADTDTDADADTDPTDVDTDPTDVDTDPTDVETDTDAATDTDTDTDSCGRVWPGSVTFEGPLAAADMQLFCDRGYGYIAGDLFIRNVGTVAPLTCLCEVGGDATVQGSFPDVDGLNQLQHVGGDFSFGNDVMTDLAGFDALASIDGNDLDIDGAELTDISGFGALTSTNGRFSVHCPKLQDISGFDGGLVSTTNGITLSGLEITTLSGFTNLSTNDVYIANSDNLTGATGFANAQIDNLTLISNNKLSDVGFLSNITRIGNLEVKNNPMLSTDHVNAIVNAHPNITGTVTISGNATP